MPPVRKKRCVGAPPKDTTYVPPEASTSTVDVSDAVVRRSTRNPHLRPPADSYLDQLPNELLMQVFKMLSQPDQHAARITCMRFYRMMSSDHDWLKKSDMTMRFDMKASGSGVMVCEPFDRDHWRDFTWSIQGRDRERQRKSIHAALRYVLPHFKITRLTEVNTSPWQQECIREAVREHCKCGAAPHSCIKKWYRREKVRPKKTTIAKKTIKKKK